MGKLIGGIYKDNFTIQIMKKLLFFQSSELTKLHKYNEVEFKETELYEIRNDQAILDYLLEAKPQKIDENFEVKLQEIKQDHQLELQKVKEDHKVDIESYIKEIDNLKHQIEELNCTMTTIESEKEQLNESCKSLKSKKRDLKKELKNQAEAVVETNCRTEQEIEARAQEIEAEFDDR